MTLLEVVVAMAVLTLAFAMYSGAVIALGRQNQMMREEAVAGDACQEVIETMRSEPFAQLYSLYNHDTADDPLGEDTAPGARFEVWGLDPAPGAPEEIAGEVFLPEIEVSPGVWQLREDIDDPDLGMPRDLNGDSRIDGLDHSSDYIHLPTLLRVEWKGLNGVRRFEIVTMCTEYRR